MFKNIMPVTAYELTNAQRIYFGLDPIEDHWDRVTLKGDTYRPESILYFDGDVIKRHIVSTVDKYSENQYNEPTNDRNAFPPKTAKGKETKLSATALEKKKELGVYLSVNEGVLIIGNYDTQTTFYSSYWENGERSTKTAAQRISDFIANSPEDHLQKMNEFKNSKKKNIKYRSGDYFCFKLDRTNFGFGRLLLDVNKVRKQGLVSTQHGLSLMMGLPLVVQLFAFKAATKNIEIAELDKQPKLPACIMMDNLLVYGEYEIIGHRDLQEEEFEFPISYGKCTDARPTVFLQWGLIHKELPLEKFNRYTTGDNESDRNPYGFYGIGYMPTYGTVDIKRTLKNNGTFNYSSAWNYMGKWDLRNPDNKKIKDEIFIAFGLDPNKSYLQNCKLTGTILTTDLIKKLK